MKRYPDPKKSSNTPPKHPSTSQKHLANSTQNISVLSSTLIKKSLAASFLIGLGNFVLLKLGSPLGPFLFAFGLLSVCILNLNLFTGKCGFVLEDNISQKTLLSILLFNLLGGYFTGLIFSFADNSVVAPALAKIATWHFSPSFFIQACLCGAIMYLAVAIFRKNSPLGILFGVPLFIFCGFQHCIANIITLGIAHTFHWSILLAIIGNYCGAFIAWWLCTELPSKQKPKKCYNTK